MTTKELIMTDNNSWKPIPNAFYEWLDNRETILEPGLSCKPTIKVLIFLALYDSKKACTYDELRVVLRTKNVVEGDIPDNTLRTSILSLSKTLDKFEHAFKLESPTRGRFQLVTRTLYPVLENLKSPPQDPVVLITDPAIDAEQVAFTLIEKSVLSLPSLYFLEWSARWWETYSSKEAEIRVNYEADALHRLGIKARLSKSQDANKILGIVSLAPGEGLAEIGLLKKILKENQNEVIHYLAIDSSPRLLRDHIGLLKETFTPEIESGRILCAGIVADIFNGLRGAIEKSKHEFKAKGIISPDSEFLPASCSLLVTNFGNCLGNYHQDEEAEFFSMIHSIFENRPLEILIGVSVMRSTPDEYIRIWDDFLLQTPRHLLETKKLLKSSRSIDSDELAEFTLKQDRSQDDRCPPVVPEQYIVRHQIEGQIYRFHYRLAFDLELANATQQTLRKLPKGTLILLFNIIKYNMQTLVDGIKKGGIFNIAYDKDYHQVVDTSNGKREYAVFSAYLEK